MLVALVTGGMVLPPGDPPLVEPLAVPGPEWLAQLAEVQVVLTAESMLGLSRQPGWVPGGGAVDLDHGVELARDARWRRVLVDGATGAVTVPRKREVPPVSATTYRPRKHLRRHVVTRDGTCVAPSCDTPGSQCQIDHTRAFADGGATTAGNTAPECERDHEAKTHLGWRQEQPEPGRFRWTSAAGATYDVPVRPVLPGWVHRDDGASEPIAEHAPA